MGLYKVAKRTLNRRKGADVPDCLLDGDHLLCQGGKGFSNDVITIATGGPYYHGAMFYWQAGKPYVVEMVGDHGGRKLPWEEWLNRDGVVDVHRPDLNHDLSFNRPGAVKWMLENVVGQPYGWKTIERFASQHNWITGWWNHPCQDEDAPCPDNFVCTTAVAAADKYGGRVHPARNLWVGDVHPSALATANILTYLTSVTGKAVSAGLGQPADPFDRFLKGAA